MRKIEEAFESLKESSAISDIEEITATFIKSEEQNLSLLSHLTMLSQEVDDLAEKNKELLKEREAIEILRLQKLSVQDQDPSTLNKKRLKGIIDMRKEEIQQTKQKISSLQTFLEVHRLNHLFTLLNLSW